MDVSLPSPCDNRNSTLSKPLLHSKARILVAEDDPVNQQATLIHLEKLGYSADLVENGEEALQALEKAVYDVVLMDCQMPRLSGYETAAEIRRREARGNHTIIIALTADGEREQCLKAGMDDHLSKPVDAPTLAARLQFWTERQTEHGEETARENETNGVAEWSNPALKAGESEGPSATGPLRTQLSQTFLQDVPLRLSAMRDALSRHDAHALEQAAHALKSSSALMGEQQMAVWCETLETQGEKGSLDSATESLQKLEEEFEHVRLHLNDF